MYDAGKILIIDDEVQISRVTGDNLSANDTIQSSLYRSEGLLLAASKLLILFCWISSARLLRHEVLAKLESGTESDEYNLSRSSEEEYKALGHEQ